MNDTFFWGGEQESRSHYPLYIFLSNLFAHLHRLLFHVFASVPSSKELRAIVPKLCAMSSLQNATANSQAYAMGYFKFLRKTQQWNCRGAMKKNCCDTKGVMNREPLETSSLGQATHHNCERRDEIGWF